MTQEDIRSLAQDASSILQENTELCIANAKECLGQKYGMSFEALKIGNRLDRDTADLWMVPEDDPSLSFKAVINNDTMECRDNYVRRSVGRRLSAGLTGKLSEDGIRAACVIKPLSGDDSGETEPMIPIEEYAERYGLSGLLIYMIVPAASFDGDAQDKIKAACSDLGERYHATAVLCCYVIGERYEECESELLADPDVNSGDFDYFSVDHTFRYASVYEAE